MPLVRLSRRQQGFTLIELMVVVVIVAVLLSVTVVSIKPNESALVRQQTAAFKGLLLSVCDQSAFEQKLFLLMVSPEGTSVAKWQRGQWQAHERFSDQSWQQGIQVDWEADAQVAQQQNWPKQGWMCWPSGEVLAGAVSFQLGDSVTQLRWDEMMRFTETRAREED